MTMKKGKKTALIIILVIAAATACYFGIKVAGYLLEQNAAEKDVQEIRARLEIAVKEREDLSALAEQYRMLNEENKDFAGWIRLPAAQIDYPVMKPPESDPEYYLRRNFEREWSSTGTPFFSNVSDPVKPTEALIIYGHRNQAGNMFEGLYGLLKEEVWEEPFTVNLDTLTHRLWYRPAFLIKTQVTDSAGFAYWNISDFAGKGDFNIFIDECRQRASFSKGAMPVYGDEILILSTCEYSKKEGRLLLVCTLADRQSYEG